METYAPQSVDLKIRDSEKVNNVLLFDMGQNLSGFRVPSKGKGDMIRLTVAENVHEDGTVNQSQSHTYYYTYTLKGW